ncbi:hypothetical protein F4825DRAFT_430714 [Nemania diffusa]|nr:hypothetical protein F4825DRAFT_430714 [Nemania diffusa]
MRVERAFSAVLLKWFCSVPTCTSPFAHRVATYRARKIAQGERRGTGTEWVSLPMRDPSAGSQLGTENYCRKAWGERI